VYGVKIMKIRAIENLHLGHRDIWYQSRRILTVQYIPITVPGYFYANLFL
jgi:hypothetical protein